MKVLRTNKLEFNLKDEKIQYSLEVELLTTIKTYNQTKIYL